ncbi:hypothetical protein L915_00752, partial [Phytophthora nicotianae]
RAIAYGWSFWSELTVAPNQVKYLRAGKTRIGSGFELCRT